MKSKLHCESTPGGLRAPTHAPGLSPLLYIQMVLYYRPSDVHTTSHQRLKLAAAAQPSLG